jgi:hypothetical protein
MGCKPQVARGKEKAPQNAVEKGIRYQVTGRRSMGQAFSRRGITLRALEL